MFSGLSKLADKAFILGYFIPALFGLAWILVANRDIPQFRVWLDSASSAEKGLGNVVASLFLLWSAAVILMVLNLHIFKIFEGYYWPLNVEFFRQWQIRRGRKRWKPFNDDLVTLRGLRDEIAALEKADPRVDDNAKKLSDKRAAANTVRLRANATLNDVNREYLKEEQYILGTRLGNVIRCFETYPADMYDVSSIVMWPRIADVISKDYMEVINEARAEVDMYLSFTTVLLGIALFTVARALAPVVCDAPLLPLSPSLTTVIVTVAASVLLSRVMYLLAVRSAKSWWGETYKGGYDLYLDLLAKKLGYTLPADAAKRREFWRMVSNRFRYYAHADMPELRTPEPAAGKSTGQEGPPEAAVPGDGAGGSEAEKEDEDEDETD
jgi:hypothetical protein